MESIIPFAMTAMEALAQSWSFNSPTTDNTTNTCSPGTAQGNGAKYHGASEGDVKNMARTPLTSPIISQDGSGPVTGDKLPSLPDQISQPQPDGAMPSATLEAQDSSESDNDISTVIRKRKRTRPGGVRQDSGSQNPASNISPNKPLTISSETPFTKVTDQTTNTWSSFIVGNFFHEVRKDDTPKIGTPGPQEDPVSNVSNLHRGDDPGRGQIQVPATTESRRGRSTIAEGNSETRNSRHNHTSPSGESRTKRRKLDRQNNRTMGTNQHRGHFDRQPPFVAPESSGKKDLRHQVSSRYDLQPKVEGQNHTDERGPMEIPSEILSREIFKAVKHMPITAEAKARQRLIDIKQGRGPAKTDEELFKFFEAKQPTQQRNRIVEGLLDPEKQREAVDNGFSYPPTTGFRTRARPLNVSQSGGGGLQKQPAPQPRLNIPKKQNIILPKIKTQTQLSAKSSTAQNLKPSQPGPSKGARDQARAQPQQPIPTPTPIAVPSVSPEPTDASPPPAPPPTQTVSAEEFLGSPERLVRQWVVYRTQRFAPLKTLASGQLITVDKQKRKIRCSTHISKRAANEAAAARHERVHKDVVRKSWSLTGFGKGLFEGMLECGAGDGGGTGAGKGGEGDVTHFWVEEEVTDLAKVTEKRSLEGKRFLLDVRKAGVYARKRYDVWSIIVYPTPGSTEKSQRDNLVVDCGGAGDEDEDEEDEMSEGDENDNGDEEGENDGVETRGTNNVDEKEGQVSGQSPGDSTGSSETLTGGDTDNQQATMNSANTDISFSSATTTLVGEEVIVGTSPGLTINTTCDTMNPQTPSKDISTDANMGSCQISLAEEASSIAEADVGTKHGKGIDVNIDTSTHSKIEDSQEKKQQQTPEVDATTGHSPSPSPPPTPRSHPKIKPPVNPFTIILPPKPTLHGSYTTPQAANVAALQAFLDLTKPKNARIEDHHFYKHFLAPQMEKQFWEEHKADPDTPVKIQWDATDALEEGCKWEFLHIEVQVVEAELEGVVDLGGMDVDGGPPIDVKGKGKEKEVEGDLPAVMEEEDESDISGAE